MPTYEVGVYNKHVRKAVRAGEDPPIGLDEKWEQTYLYELKAESISSLKQIVESKFPAALGYVVDGIVKVDTGGVPW
jgi:hypothetical protein